MGNLRRVTGYRIVYLVFQNRLTSDHLGVVGNFTLILEAEPKEGEKNKKILKMYNIPPEIAIELGKLNSSDEDGVEDVSNMDFRYTFVDALLELPSIEEILRRSISEIVIDKLHSETNVYSARVVLKETYSGMQKEIRMIPSHAVLLSVLGNIPLYVSEDLLTDDDTGLFKGDGDDGGEGLKGPIEIDDIDELMDDLEPFEDEYFGLYDPEDEDDEEDLY